MESAASSELAQKVTVVMVPRERLSTAPKTLQRLVETLPHSVPLIVVDGAYPPSVRESIEAVAKNRALHWLRREYFLLPCEARNLSLPFVTTPYIVFVDNDVILEGGWLEKVVLAAEASGATAVAPLTTIRVPRGGQPQEFVHHAGGIMRYVVYRQRLTYASTRRNEWDKLDNPSLDALSKESEDIEFHMFLIDTAVLRSLGGFDEGYSTSDHDDLSMRLHMIGGRTTFCRDAKVCYDATGTITSDDLDYFTFRWSRPNIAMSCRTFRKNWLVTQRFSWEWASAHRKKVLSRFAPRFFRRLPQPLFDLYFNFLRLRSRRRPAERNRKALGQRHECPTIPREVALFYRRELKDRNLASPFPELPAELRSGLPLSL